MKTTVTYWNPLASEHAAELGAVAGSGDLLQLTVAEDPATGDYTRLTRFRDGYSTGSFGAKATLSGRDPRTLGPALRGGIRDLARAR